MNSDLIILRQALISLGVTEIGNKMLRKPASIWVKHYFVKLL